MRYAISYVSTAQIDLSDLELNEIITKTKNFNDSRKITGILLYNEGNFFQLIEGEKNDIQSLYEKINLDSRHHNIIKFMEQPVFRCSLDGYFTDFISETKKYDQTDLKIYLNYIENLDSKTSKSIKRVIELMLT